MFGLTRPCSHSHVLKERYRWHLCTVTTCHVDVASAGRMHQMHILLCCSCIFRGSDVLFRFLRAFYSRLFCAKKEGPDIFFFSAQYGELEGTTKLLLGPPCWVFQSSGSQTVWLILTYCYIFDVPSHKGYLDSEDSLKSKKGAQAQDEKTHKKNTTESLRSLWDSWPNLWCNQDFLWWMWWCFQHSCWNLEDHAIM